MRKSKNHPNPGADWDDHIVLYDPAFQNEQYLQRVLAHELAHENFMSLLKVEQRDYARAAGWTIHKSENGEQKFEPPRCCFVDTDGNSSLEEDFANNVEYFLVEPDKLKKTNPNAFRWIEKHFGKGFRIGTAK